MTTHRASTTGSSAWFKSSYSGGNETECVEVAMTDADVLIRDSKHADGPRLLVSSAAWSRFIAEAAEQH